MPYLGISCTCVGTILYLVVSGAVRPVPAGDAGVPGYPLRLAGDGRLDGPRGGHGEQGGRGGGVVCIVVGCWLLLSAVGAGAVGGTGGVAGWGGVALTGRGGVALAGRGVAQLGGWRRFLALALPLPRGGHRAAI